MKRLGVLLAIVVIGAVAGALAAVVAHRSDKQRVLDACHAAIQKQPAAKGRFFDEQVAIPAQGSYVVTGLIGTAGAGAQWSCDATVSNGKVRLTGAEIRP